ncbi:flagellar biosynthesis protein FlhB [Thalassobius vesicularis]|uniref:Flagellar biosynthesis protein FlhB n=1 Tax=Thalassobius vesicularis TaxID=1294297 RepID=A0A4S3M9B2_9RHOB|nr:flagellar type III secretion system protein FlhB [Thalassobius vesicularis]THD73809.1 flagellar biosynthesis protein FlhB [Thalassobius vesicularis]
MSSEDDSDKSFEPTQRKLDEARKKGEIARSNDIIAASSLAGLLLALAVFGQSASMGLGGSLAAILARADSISTDLFAGGSGTLTGQLLAEVGLHIGAWFAFPVLAASIAIFLQRAFLFTPQKLMPKLQRISLVSNAKQKFGPAGLFDFGKNFLKLVVFSTVLGIFIYSSFPLLALSPGREPALTIVFLGSISLRFLAVVVVVMFVFGAVDYLWQRHRHLQKNRMSMKEMRDEHKEAEGDPHIKNQRRQRAQQVASRNIVTEVKSADVVIVNPTHYAVALKWDRTAKEAPRCVAKGVDEIAYQIRQIARENGVPIHSDPPTARALYASTDVNAQIREEHFRAVAVAIRFAEKMRKKASSFR